MKNFFKNKLIIYGSFVIILSISSLIYASLLYFSKIKPLDNTNTIITFAIGSIAFLILGFISGILSGKNGLVEGLFSGIMIILISLIFNVFLKIPFTYKTLLKISIYLLASSLGGIIGVNIKFRHK